MDKLWTTQIIVNGELLLDLKLTETEIKALENFVKDINDAKYYK